jgi:hypothetical protein
VCVCVRACVRAHARGRGRARAGACVCVCGGGLKLLLNEGVWESGCIDPRVLTSALIGGEW